MAWYDDAWGAVVQLNSAVGHGIADTFVAGANLVAWVADPSNPFPGQNDPPKTTTRGTYNFAGMSFAQLKQRVKTLKSQISYYNKSAPSPSNPSMLGLKGVNAALADKQGQLEAFKAYSNQSDPVIVSQISDLNSAISILKQEKHSLKATIKVYQEELNALNAYMSIGSHRLLPGDKGYVAPTNPTPTNLTPTPPKTSSSSLDKKPLKMNASAVKYAYLSPAAYTSQFAGSSQTYDTKITSPSAITNAHQLWTNALGHKGMVVMYIPKDYNASATATPSNISGAVSQTDTSLSTDMWWSKIQDRYAFQFLYNPTTISMQYQGILKNDPSVYTSGNAVFNPNSSSLSQSTITFDLILNRMLDFTYYDDATQKVKSGINIKDLYPIPPTEEEQPEIYNKGTMYDLERLLRTLVGFGLSSRFVERNSADGLTADIGFLVVRPLELHLGKSLRYLVQISGLSVKHIIFDHRMVPLLSSVTVTANRIPDHGL